MGPPPMPAPPPRRRVNVSSWIWVPVEEQNKLPRQFIPMVWMQTGRMRKAVVRRRRGRGLCIVM